MGRLYPMLKKLNRNFWSCSTWYICGGKKDKAFQRLQPCGEENLDMKAEKDLYDESEEAWTVGRGLYRGKEREQINNKCDGFERAILWLHS